MSSMLKKIRAFAADYTNSFILIIAGAIGIAISAVFVFHGIAQWDMICVNPVWASAESNVNFYQDLIRHGYSRFAELPFQDGLFFRTSVGNAYDFFLALIAVGWILVLVSVVVMMLGVVLFYRDKRY